MKMEELSRDIERYRAYISNLLQEHDWDARELEYWAGMTNGLALVHWWLGEAESETENKA